MYGETGREREREREIGIIYIYIYMLSLSIIYIYIYMYIYRDIDMFIDCLFVFVFIVRLVYDCLLYIILMFLTLCFNHLFDLLLAGVLHLCSKYIVYYIPIYTLLVNYYYYHH